DGLTSSTLFRLLPRCCRAQRGLHSFPTRRSSDLGAMPGNSSGGSLEPMATEMPQIPISALADIAFKTGPPSIRTENDVRQGGYRSEEHTSELQSRGHLVCRLMLEKKMATWI